jgi:hypothetical protein
VGGITNFINFSLLHNPVNVAHRGVSYTKQSRGKYLGGQKLNFVTDHVYVEI